MQRIRHSALVISGCAQDWGVDPLFDELLDRVIRRFQTHGVMVLNIRARYAQMARTKDVQSDWHLDATTENLQNLAALWIDVVGPESQARCQPSR